jgi:hypothetical protein
MNAAGGNADMQEPQTQDIQRADESVGSRALLGAAAAYTILSGTIQRARVLRKRLAANRTVPGRKLILLNNVVGDGDAKHVA